MALINSINQIKMALIQFCLQMLWHLATQSNSR